MCAHSILLFRIPRVVILDDVNTNDFVTSVEALKNKGVQVTLVEHKPSIDLNSRFQTDPSTRKVWMGDVGV
jgi:cytosine deaminase